MERTFYGVTLRREMRLEKDPYTSENKQWNPSHLLVMIW